MVRLAVVCVLALACSISASARSKHHPQPSQPAQATAFDYYVLSLSWSPTYCETHQSDTAQCGSLRYGFVLHGLWPQYRAGGYPQTCKTTQSLTDEARQLGAKVFPSEKLVAHEWDKHGTCSELSAKAYFEQADAARKAIAVPDALLPGSRTTSLRAQEVARLLRDANPKLTAKSIAITCGKGELSEVRVCLSKDLEPVGCGADVRNSCGAGPVRIPGTR